MLTFETESLQGAAAITEKLVVCLYMHAWFLQMGVKTSLGSNK